MAIGSTSRPNQRGAISLYNRLKPGDWTFTTLTGLAGVLVILVIIGVFIELTEAAWPAIKANGVSVLWDTDWNPSAGSFGVGVFIIGTMTTSIVALVCATVIAVLVSLFLVEVAPSYVARPVSYLVELLAAIPSVVYGLWGIFVMGVFIRDRLGPTIVTYFDWLPFVGGPPLITSLFPPASFSPS